VFAKRAIIHNEWGGSGQAIRLPLLWVIVTLRFSEAGSARPVWVEAVRKRDCRYASRNNLFAAPSIRFEGFNARPACDTKVLVVVTVRRFHTASVACSRSPDCQ
jgi:hypothetical protein